MDAIADFCTEKSPFMLDYPSIMALVNNNSLSYQCNKNNLDQPQHLAKFKAQIRELANMYIKVHALIFTEALLQVSPSVVLSRW